MSGDTQRVLLVEDDVDLSACLALVLEEANYLVTVASDGEAALQACAEGPALALVDIHLPGEPTGPELVRAIRARCPPGTRVLMMSAQRERPEVTRAAGADGYLEKPFDIDELLRTVERHLGAQTAAHPSP